VGRAEPGAARSVLSDRVIPGFWLVVEPGGRRTFKLRYRVGGDELQLARTGTHADLFGL
jgi:hypothetical protein